MKPKDLPSPFYRVSLKAVILDEQSRILVVQTADGTWELPGGGWEHDEPAEQCLARELSEELQVQVAAIQPGALCYYTNVNVRDYMALKIAISVTLKSQDFTPSDGMVAAKFVTKDELLRLEMYDDEEGIKDNTDQIWPTS